MNFEELKNEMNQAAEQESDKVARIDLNRGKNNPVQLIRSNMKREIITQLVCIVIFMTYPLVVKMADFNESMYYIFMFITSVMTLAYIIKLTFFLNKTSHFDSNTKDAIQSFIFEAKLTLEVYKSFIIAGALLLPVPVFAVLDKSSATKITVFEKWFRLEITSGQLTLLVIGYLLVAIIIYFITVAWTKLLYGKYLKQLEEVSKSLD